MAKKVNAIKLAQLKKYIREGGDTDLESVAEALKILATSKATIDRYIDELNTDDEFEDFVIGQENPFSSDEDEDEEDDTDTVEDDEDDDDVQDEDSEDADSSDDSDDEDDDSDDEDDEDDEAPLPLFYKDPKTGLLRELELVKRSSKRVVVTDKAAKPAWVKLVVRGKTVQVDANVVKSADPAADSEFPGITNSYLAQMIKFAAPE